MNLREAQMAEPALSEQTLGRTSAPAAPRNQGHEHLEGEHEEHAFEWPEMLRIALVALLAAAVWFRWGEPLRAISVIGVGGLLVGGWPIFKEAFDNLIT